MVLLNGIEQENIKKWKQEKRHITGVYMHRRLEAARAEKPRRRANALSAGFLRHIWGRGQCFALPSYLPQTSHTARRYATFFLKFFWKFVVKITFWRFVLCNNGNFFGQKYWF
ncbi:hypothetical protein Holit_03420 [Hollandina sp. SP2]